MKHVSNITVAMMKDPVGGSWLGQVHVEFANTKAKDVVRLRGDTPMHVLEAARNKIEKRYQINDGSIVLCE